MIKQFNIFHNLFIFLQIERTGPNAGYFTEEIVLNRVPGLLLLLAGVYLVLGLFGSLMINQPPEDWIRRKSVSKYNESDSIEMNTDNEKPMLEIKSEDDAYIHWKDALRMKEFYILWITRLSVVLITQVCNTPPIAEILFVKNGRAIVVCGFLMK